VRVCACKVAPHDSLPCKPSYNWSPSVCSCLYRVSYDVSSNRYPARCEIRPVIHFLHSKNMSVAELHHELCTVVYGKDVMSEGTVRQWCGMFKDGQANKCSRWRAKWSTICCEWWSYSKRWATSVKDSSSQFQNFRVNFHKSPNCMHSSLRDYYSYPKLSSHVLRKMGSENAHECAERAENVFGVDFLDRYNKDGD
jgi:hypothetical protein